MGELVLRFAAEHGEQWALVTAALVALLRSRPARTLGKVVAGWIEYLFLRYPLRMTRDDARARVLAHWDERGRS